MLINGLVVSYANGVNTVWMSALEVFAAFQTGALLCSIFQGETLDAISRRLKIFVEACPFRDLELSQDSIEEAEKYVLAALMYDDFVPAQRLAQGSFIRCMEYYRALDSETAWTILEEEQKRVAVHSDLFSDIGFSTVGDYMRMCFNNYAIDLSEAKRLFSCMAAVRSGMPNKDELREYREFRNALQDDSRIPGIQMKTKIDPDTGEFSRRFVISSFLSMAVFEFSHLEESSTKIVRCQNPECGKFFTAKRNTAMYCDFPAPQKQSKTCKEYHPQFLYRKREKDEETSRLLKNAHNRLRNYRNRHEEYGEEIDGYIRTLQISGPGKKQDVLSGDLSIAQFQEWLDSLKHEKENY